MLLGRVIWKKGFTHHAYYSGHDEARSTIADKQPRKNTKVTWPETGSKVVLSTRQ